MRKIAPFSLLLLAAFCFLLLSFNKKEITVEIQGTVTTEKGVAVPGVKIQLKKENLPKGKAYYAPTKPDGSYNFQIHAYENEKITLRFKKDGYALNEQVFYPNSDNLKPNVSTQLFTAQPVILTKK